MGWIIVVGIIVAVIALMIIRKYQKSEHSVSSRSIDLKKISSNKRELAERLLDYYMSTSPRSFQISRYATSDLGCSDFIDIIFEENLGYKSLKSYQVIELARLIVQMAEEKYPSAKFEIKNNGHGWIRIVFIHPQNQLKSF